MEDKRLAAWPYSSIPPGVSRMVLDNIGTLLVCGQQGNVIDIYQASEETGAVHAQRGFIPVDKSELVKVEFPDPSMLLNTSKDDPRTTEIMMDRAMVIYKEDLPMQTFYRQLVSCPGAPTRAKRKLASVTLNGNVSVHMSCERSSSWDKSCSISAALLSYLSSHHYKLPSDSPCSFQLPRIIKSIGEVSRPTAATVPEEHDRRQLVCTEALDWCKAASRDSSRNGDVDGEVVAMDEESSQSTDGVEPFLLVTAQRTGHILFWNVPSRTRTFKPSLLYSYRSEESRPLSVLRLPSSSSSSGDGSSLCCAVGYANGKVLKLTAATVTSATGCEVTSVDTLWLWSDDDGLPVTRLATLTRNGENKLLVAKNDLILVLSLAAHPESSSDSHPAPYLVVPHPYGLIVDVSVSANNKRIVVTGLSHVSQLVLPSLESNDSDNAMEEDGQFKELSVSKFELAYYVSSAVSPNAIAIFTSTCDSTFVTTRAFPVANAIYFDCISTLDEIVGIIVGWTHNDCERIASWDIRSALQYHLNQLDQSKWPRPLSALVEFSDASMLGNNHLRTIVWLASVGEKLFKMEKSLDWKSPAENASVELTKRLATSLASPLPSGLPAEDAKREARLRAADWLVTHCYDSVDSLQAASEVYSCHGDALSLAVITELATSPCPSETVLALATRQTCPICVQMLVCQRQGGLARCSNGHIWSCCFSCFSILDGIDVDGKDEVICSQCSWQYCCGIAAGDMCRRCGGDVS